MTFWLTEHSLSFLQANDPFSVPVTAVRKHSALNTVSKVTWKVTITKDTYTMHFHITMDQRCVPCFVSGVYLGTTEQHQLFVYQNKRSKRLLCASVSEREEIRAQTCVFVMGQQTPEISPGSLCLSLWPSSTSFLSARWKRVLTPEVSGWLPKGQPEARKGYYFPIHVYKVVSLYLSLEHELVLCFTQPLVAHWRARQSWGGPLPFWIVCRPDSLRATVLRHWATEQAPAKF